MGLSEGETEIRLSSGDYYRFLRVLVKAEEAPFLEAPQAPIAQGRLLKLEEIARAVEGYDGKVSIQKYGTGIPFTVSDEERQDLSFSSEVTLYGRGVASVLWRVCNRGRFYCIDLDAARNRVRLWKRVDGSDVEISCVAQAVAVNTPHALALEAVGEQMKVILNGKTVIEARDGEISSGKLGFNASISDVSFGHILCR